jgi:FixJ family two-component response regulator
MDMLHEIKFDSVSVGSIIHLGKSLEADVKPRPIKIVTASEAQKDKVLTQAKVLKSKDSRRLDKIYIHKDLTPKQRQQRQQLVKELKNRQVAREPNLIIVNKRTVSRKPRVN